MYMKHSLNNEMIFLGMELYIICAHTHTKKIHYYNTVCVWFCIKSQICAFCERIFTRLKLKCTNEMYVYEMERKKDKLIFASREAHK